ncbi:DUF866-domain-containing protein [Hesseltinella vesiculosa]|uniref:DUF866-domain-containing protein n=1 Tax=Hesseltinella vesiculosa TaxID=101127 RepID=A0A1X2G383_9FUNG|nr:DUF866-domain-containing protein [Hesseltinella vesiculosa]
MKLALYFKADLENVTNLAPTADKEWHFKIECSSCHEVDDNWISFNSEELHDVTGSRGQANLVMKCKFCKREATAQFETSAKMTPISESGQFQKLATFDVRGLELVKFSPRESWTVKGLESNTVFDDVDLTEGEWAEYDEEAGEPVGISNFEVEFRKIK